MIHINQYNESREKMGDIDKKVPDVSALVTTTVLNTKVGEIENKIPDTSNLVTTAVLNKKN